MLPVRAEFAEAMVALNEQRADVVFLTLDLGYMALEELATAYGERFINVGVAEQNAVSVAAGLARVGWLPWVYNIASFAVLRPCAQIRDCVCLHKLPVKLVGNGGGYGYGIMGPTHHALEDVGVMRALPNMRTYLPVMALDVPQVVQMMAADPLPNYLRLNVSAELPHAVPPFAPWRKLKSGSEFVVIAAGAIVQSLYELHASLLDELEIWSVGVFPLGELPAELVSSVQQKRGVITVEEHYRGCGLGEAVSHSFLTSGVVPRSFVSLCAAGYPSESYGSQRWHQRESGLAGPELARRLEEAIRG